MDNWRSVGSEVSDILILYANTSIIPILVVFNDDLNTSDYAQLNDKSITK